MRRRVAGILLLIATWVAGADFTPTPLRDSGATFNPKTDLISLHYDHAADRDDGHSAAADRTMLQSLYGKAWIVEHVIAVSGTTGKNDDRFVHASNKVMNAVWNDVGSWLAAHNHHQLIVQRLTERWGKTLAAGGDIYVKEGGQSDITAAVVRALLQKTPDLDPPRRIHVVQHSNWNEEQTTDAALQFVRDHTDYIRIADANRYLARRGGDPAFVQAALANPKFSTAWQAAFDYLDPTRRLDFSDTGELMRIVGLEKMNIDAFRQRFLDPR